MHISGTGYFGGMAKDTGKGHAKAPSPRAPKARTQNGRLHEAQRNAREQEEGRVHGRKEDGKPFKGVAKEPDKRRK